jgi:hypothetical protein
MGDTDVETEIAVVPVVAVLKVSAAGRTASDSQSARYFP